MYSCYVFVRAIPSARELARGVAAEEVEVEHKKLFQGANASVLLTSLSMVSDAAGSADSPIFQFHDSRYFPAEEQDRQAEVAKQRAPASISSAADALPPIGDMSFGDDEQGGQDQTDAGDVRMQGSHEI